MDEKYKDIEVVIRYELYQGIPVVNKQAIVKTGEQAVKVTYLANDQLDVSSAHKEDIYIETDYNGGSDLNNGRSLSFQWDESDVVTTRFDMGPNWNVEPNSTFESFRTYELLHSVGYYEWKSLEIQNMYRIVADVGFDMIIQSFGSGINMESTNQSYIDRVKADYDYAHSKGVDIGGYTLAVVRDYGPINGPEAMNGDPNDILRCLATNWSEGYWNNIKNFIEQTGTDIIEIDGPYHFYECNIDDKSAEIRAEHQHEGKLDLRKAIETFEASRHKVHNGDVTEDGKVDVADLALVAYYYQENPNSDNWEQAKKADVNKDDRIDISDLALIAQEILGIKE